MYRSAIWHISDTHFGHHRCGTEWRGFATIADHDKAIIARCQDLIDARDTVYHHGDVGLGRDDQVLEAAAQIPGAVHLILGNHDKAHPMHRGALRRQARWLDVFASVHTSGQRRLGDRRVMMSHFPYSGDHHAEERYPEWRLRDAGDWLLCGHVHHLWLASGRQINVGVDQWGMGPAPEAAVAAMMRAADLGRAAEVAAIRDRWLEGAR